MRSGRECSARAPACRPTRPPSPWSRSARSCATSSIRASPTDAELKFAKDSIAIALPGNNETSDEIANSYGEILTFGFKDSYWNDFVGDLTSLTTADINKAAGRLIHPEALTWVVVGDLSKIEKGVRALNIGEVTILDTDGKVVVR